VFNIAESGVWGDAVRKRRPIIINDYKSLRSKKGYPPGHVNIERFMAVPLFDEGKIVAVAAAGNKAEEYVDHDVQQLQLLLEGMWQIIKRKRVEEEFNSQARMITTFTNSVAHDLKNPALAIHGLARVLKEKHKNLPAEKLVNFIDQIAKSAEQIIALSEDINSYISSRDAPLHIKDLDLHQIWQTIREEFVPQLRKREISGHEMEGAIPAIRADRNSLLRVFRNLVDNALKYGGSNLSELTFIYDFSGTHHILGVANNGKPIPVSEVESIFDIFTRSGDESAPAGTGLGLAIVREIARHHGGDSWVETGVSCTTFYISISRNL
jgi:signal transduction histidine kinase